IRVPLAVRPRTGGSELKSTVGDLSEGGLAFACDSPLEPGTVVEVSLPLADQPFLLVGCVRRCEPAATSEFRIGVEFLHPAMSFRMKLAEQILRIQELRRELSRERGEEISNEEAARQWVERYAAEFANLYS
ncbi:MAG: PilZ domain-containing protein, partial [Candidatus Binatia bacterium]